MTRAVQLRNLLVVLWFALGAAGLGLADETNHNHGFVFSFAEENDFPGTDRHYTQGIHIGLLWPDETAPLPTQPLTWLPDFGIAGATHKYGLRVGQDMYTPVNKTNNPPDQADRPYGGWLFLGFIRDSRGTVANDIPARDYFEVDLGVVGPASFARDAQIWWHEVTNAGLPQGWDYQIKNEPGFLISGDRQLKIWDTGTNQFLQAQFLPHAGFNLGNIQTSVRLGTEFRLGHNIPDEFAKIPEPKRGWYIFGGVDGRFVGYNEFLDGNAFRSSRSVTKEPAVLEIHGGLVVVLGSTQISYTYNYVSQEFKTQAGYDAYNSIALTQTF